MNKKVKGLVIIIAIVVICILAYLAYFWFEATPLEEETNKVPSKPKYDYVKENKDGVRTNVSKKFSEKKTVENFTVTKDLFASKAEKTEIILNVKNNSDKESELQKVELTLLDKEGKEIQKLSGLIGETKPGETTMLYISASLDFTHAYDYKIEIVK